MISLYCFIHFECFVFSLMLDNAFKPSMLFTDNSVYEPLREFAPLSDDHVLELLD